MPWEPRRVTLYRTIFPEMTNWLPEEEARNCVLNSRRNWRGSRPRNFGLDFGLLDQLRGA